MTVQRGSCNSSTAEADIFSATTIFISYWISRKIELQLDVEPQKTTATALSNCHPESL
jgi:hypothetical protein